MFSEMSALLVEDAADEGGVIHLSERLLVLAESLLQLVKLAGGRDGAEGVLRAQGPRGQGPGVVVRLRWRATVEVVAVGSPNPYSAQSVGAGPGRREGRA